MYKRKQRCRVCVWPAYLYRPNWIIAAAGQRCPCLFRNFLLGGQRVEESSRTGVAREVGRRKQRYPCRAAGAFSRGKCGEEVDICSRGQCVEGGRFVLVECSGRRMVFFGIGEEGGC